MRGLFRRIVFVLALSSPAKKIIGIINNNFKPIISLFGVSINGQILFAHTFDRLIVLFLLKFGLLEKREIELFKKTIKKGWTVLDIGANIGYPSLLFSKLVGKYGKVIAFEPDKSNISILEKNIKVNGARNIKIVPMAVSDRAGFATLYVSDSHSGDHRIYSSGEKRRTQVIEAVSLDDFFKSSDKIDFIQMDIQGAEELAFRGMRRLLNENKNINILFEFWPDGLRKIGSSPSGLLRTIEEMGFKINYIDENSNKLVQISAKECMKMSQKLFDMSLFLRR